MTHDLFTNWHDILTFIYKRNIQTLLKRLFKLSGPLNSFEFGPLFAPQLAMGYRPSNLYNNFSWPDIQMYIHEYLQPVEGQNPEEHIYVDHALMRPESYGTVRLASTDPEARPIIDPKFFDVQNDLERLVDGG
jgi:hypothetical protein